jgi:hypothetical protein
MKRSFVILLVFAALVSCTRNDDFSYKRSEATGSEDSWASKTRIESEETRNVMILYSAGFNSLANFLDDDIKELPLGFVPQKGNRADHVLLVYSKLTTRNKDTGRCILDYNVPTESALFRLYKESGKVVQDTIKVWGKEVNACSAETMHEVLQLVYDRFPAKGYGMVFTSHATGWLPSGYYTDPSKFDGSSTIWSSRRRPASQTEYPPIDPFPAVKTLGQDNNPGDPLEMELDDFVNALPFHLDYLLLDACLSGCVEVAYQLRGKADIVGFSQTEVLANGFDYLTIASRLLQNTPDPVRVCFDYFDYYDKYLERNPGASSENRSATISVVDTRKMDALAEICKTLFEKYRDKISSLSGSKVQGYFRFSRHFFYDLKDVLVKAGITAEEQAALDDALSQCVIYKAATDYFLSIKINTACGFSMYLPSMGSSYLDNFYKTRIAWNKDTELVK